MPTDDQIITAYIVTIFTLGFFLAFGTPYIWPDKETTVTCTAANHQVSSHQAWLMESWIPDQLLCDEHLKLIYPHASGDIR